jgi:ketosteroid isomerase-like protein
MLPAEIQGLIEAHINAFNTNDNNAFYEVFSDNAIIVDGIAPFCWPNPNGPEKWMSDVAKWREGLGVVKEHLSFSIVEGPAAYAVVSGTLTVTLKELSIVRKGMLSYTFAERDGVWKIGAQAWGRTS